MRDIVFTVCCLLDCPSYLGSWTGTKEYAHCHMSLRFLISNYILLKIIVEDVTE